MRTTERRQSAAGFTAVELLVTVAILAILASAVYPLAVLTVQRNKEQDLRQALFEVREALDDYKDAYDDGLIQNRIGESGYPPTLQTLVDGVTNVKSPSGQKLYFLRKVPRDPFADTQLPAEQTWGKRSYRSSAKEPQEGVDVYDIYSKSTGVGRNGIPYAEW